MISLRYSTCHFAEVMFEQIQAKHVGARPETVQRCSFCGEACELVPVPLTLDLDVELTLRRWKDGDCSLDEMFSRVNAQLQRSWQAAFQPATETLQQGGKPKYAYRIDQNRWAQSLDGGQDE